MNFEVPAGRWVVVAPDRWLLDEIAVADEDYHHLVRVLRLRKGDVVGVLDGAGGRARAELVAVSKQTASLRITERERVSVARPFFILCPSVLREGPMDLVVQAAVELGVGRIVPLATERAVAKYAGEKAKSRRERWRRIVLAEARQCGQPWLPDVDEITGVGDTLGKLPKECLRLWGSLASDAHLLRDVLRDQASKPPAAVAIFIGPEGDFTQNECTQLRNGGAQPVSFGTGVLRAEFAAIFALSALRYEFGT